MHIVLPLILTMIIFILAMLLWMRPPVIFLRTDHTTWTQGGGSPRLEEEEPLLPHAEEMDGWPSHDDQVRSMGDHTTVTSEDDWQKLADTRKEGEIDKLQRELSASASQNAELQRQIEILSRDLEIARLFLTTADAYSDSEVIQMLQKLNAELQHISTLMADHVLSIFTLDCDFVTLDPERRVVENRASESIGSTLVQSFRIVQRDDLPMYLQIAFQTYLTSHLCWIVSSWTPDQGCNSFIDEIYQRLREKERQAISARWRSLTRTYALPSCVSQPESFVKPITAGLSDILFAAGCATPQSDVISELSAMFETNILSLVSLAGRLNQMMGGVISGDFEVFAVRPGTMFHNRMMEEGTDRSEDEVQGTPSGKGGRTQTVLCTSELGLTKRVQLGMGEEKETDTKMVIKAKVILEAFLATEGE